MTTRVKPRPPEPDDVRALTSVGLDELLARYDFVTPVTMDDLVALKSTLDERVAVGVPIDLVLRDDHIALTIGIGDGATRRRLPIR